MNNNSLNGISVVVTRPEHQAEGLCEKIESLGGSVIRFPLIKIQLQENDPLLQEGKQIEDYQYYIFISRNAVDAASKIWPNYKQIFKGKKIFAIGSASKNALINRGIKDVIDCPGTGNSENLLQMNVFEKEKIHGQAVLILRGSGGRELLAESLGDRGAYVDYADLYQRLRPCYNQQQLYDLWNRETSNSIIVLSSGEALENLLAIMQPDYSSELLNSSLLVISQRVAELAKQSGFSKNIIVAKASSDDGLVNALVNSLNEEK